MTQHSALSTRYSARGFSMVELMIAIMILGLGLVMVATIFPIGLDMTRETVQRSLALTAADNAIDTIKLKVPTWHDEIANRSNNTYPPVSPDLPPPPAIVPVVLVQTPLMLPTDPYIALRGYSVPAELGIENDAIINNAGGSPEQQIIAGTPFYSRFTDGATPPRPLPELNGITPPPPPAEVVRYTRALTERSGFSGDGTGTNVPNPGITYVVRGQNLPVDFRARAVARNPIRPVLVTDGSPIFTLGGAPAYQERLPRLHLTEQLYPPMSVDVVSNAATPNRPSVAGLISDPDTATRFTEELRVANAASEQRYSWTVIQRRLLKERTFGFTVVVTARGDLSAQYAYQRDQRTNPAFPGVFDVSPAGFSGGAGADPTDSLYLPAPVTQAEAQSASGADFQNGFFPRPWLVALGLPPGTTPIPPEWRVLPDPNDPTKFFAINGRGQALCTAEVARLLPTGATLIFATGSDAGRPARVLSSTWERSELGRNPDAQNPARLQLEGAPSAFVDAAIPILIWVFPPAVLSHGGGSVPAEFDTRSPVIAAFQREVTLP